MPIPTNTGALERPSAREQVHEALRGWIVEGNLKPGERLRDSELAQALGVSRTPVREALQRLEDDGFVETSASRWTKVAEVDRNQAIRVYPIIWDLEHSATLLAAPQLTDEYLDQMNQINRRLGRALEQDASVEASREDLEFHQVLVAASGHPELIVVLEDLKVKLRRVEIAYFGGGPSAGASVAEHDSVLEHLHNGDAYAAADAVVANWQGSLKRLVSEGTSHFNLQILERMVPGFLGDSAS